MREQTLTSDDARRHWGELLEAALRGIVTVITRRGRVIAVVLSHESYERLVADASERQERPDD